jgi:hypothetical protein
MLSGEWNLGRIRDIDAELSAARLPAPVTLDGARLDTLDTAAALTLLLRLAAGWEKPPNRGALPRAAACSSCSRLR